MFFIVLSWPPASRRLSVSRWLSVTGFFLTVVNRRADTPKTERGIPSSNGRIERVPLLGCCPEVKMISKELFLEIKLTSSAFEREVGRVGSHHRTEQTGRHSFTVRVPGTRDTIPCRKKRTNLPWLLSWRIKTMIIISENQMNLEWKQLYWRRGLSVGLLLSVELYNRRGDDR